MLILIYGRSATGKTSVAEGLGFPKLKTLTTKKRETTDKDYIYVSEREFFDNDFIEYTKIDGDYYGTPFSEIDRLKTNDVTVKVCDWRGVINFSKIFNTRIVKLKARNHVLLGRYRNRGMNMKEIDDTFYKEDEIDICDIKPDLIVDNNYNLGNTLNIIRGRFSL